MTEYFISYFGFGGLFLISFLAATIIPMGSEAAVIIMVLAGYNPGLVLVVASTGNSLGALLNYFMGKWGSDFLFSRFFKTDADVLAKAEKTYGKWGSPALFFAWLPVIGDPLTVIAGALKVNIYVFLFWVVLGKSLRYFFVIKAAGMIPVP